MQKLAIKATWVNSFIKQAKTYLASGLAFPDLAIFYLHLSLPEVSETNNRK